MMNRRLLLTTAGLGAFALRFGFGSHAMAEQSFAVTHTDEEWRKILTPEQYQILRQHATERPGSCALNTEKRAGTFYCAGCGQALFTNDTKFESGTGWPSFYGPHPGAIGTTTDRAYGMTRTEVVSPKRVPHSLRAAASVMYAFGVVRYFCQ